MAWLTYSPEKGDERVVEYMGVELFAGQPVEVDNPAIVAKAHGNPWIEVSDEKPRRRGRSAADEAPAESGEGA